MAYGTVALAAEQSILSLKPALVSRCPLYGRHAPKAPYNHHKTQSQPHEGRPMPAIISHEAPAVLNGAPICRNCVASTIRPSFSRPIATRRNSARSTSGPAPKNCCSPAGWPSNCGRSSSDANFTGGRGGTRRSTPRSATTAAYAMLEQRGPLAVWEFVQKCGGFPDAPLNAGRLAFAAGRAGRHDARF